MGYANRAVLKRVGRRVQKLRAARGLTQEQLSDLAEVGQGTLSRIENGRLDTGLTNLYRLAKVLGASVGDLVDDPVEVSSDVDRAASEWWASATQEERIAVAQLVMAVRSSKSPG
jgi:transcriptional regulator with XRE-family HTH domain